MNIRSIFICDILIIIVASIIISCTFSPTNKLSECNVIWNSQSVDSWGSMPIGNGDIGANVWVTPDGNLHFYISKTDAWSENSRLLKIGKLKVNFSPNILSTENFKQELDLESGIIRIKASGNGEQITLNFWVDANNPVIHLEGNSSVPVKVNVSYDGWRSSDRKLKGQELNSAYGTMYKKDSVIVTADTILSRNNNINWCHHNKQSIWEETYSVQALEELVKKEEDPLLFLTFGALVKGNGFVSISSEELTTLEKSKNFALDVYSLTEKSKSVLQWQESINKMANEIGRISLTERRENHINWWKKFWNESYIFVSSPIDSQKVFSVMQGYQLQRYMNACAGRGNMPVKFNGSIFNVDVNRPIKNIKERYDADFRDWGGCYWWQNTRLPYWSMLYSGDFDLMKPLFKMYADALPLAKHRTQKYYGHKGACFPETMYFWGLYNNDNYGRDRSKLPDGTTENQYIRYLWEGGIELVAMMIDYFDFTSDSIFVKQTLLPIASEIIDFYRLHYEKGIDGKIIIEPAQALETYWGGTVNPMPEIAGLNFVLTKLLSLSDELIGASFKRNCEELFSELPPIPVYENNGKKLLAPAEIFGKEHNVENPELYAIFPYRLFGVGKPLLGLAVNSFEKRTNKDYKGWQQDAIQAALLGKTEEAAKMTMDNFNSSHNGSRFPAFWGPNYDWIPDQDHGAVNMRALQNMLIQTGGDEIFMFPAWPKNWDVNFKLHAPKNTIIEGEFRNGKIYKLNVFPRGRRKDVRSNS